MDLNVLSFYSMNGVFVSNLGKDVPVIFYTR